MKALYVEKNRLFMKETTMPSISCDEVLVKVKMAGICNTDLELLQGYHNFQGCPGHEFVGEVVEAPMVKNLTKKRVTAEINIGCGECDWCRNGGDGRHCFQRKCIGIHKTAGAFAEYVVVPRKNICVIADQLSNEKAIFAEPLAAALEIAQQIHILANSRIAIIGDGKLGMLCAWALRLYSMDVLLIGKHEEKLRLAKANSDIQTTLLNDLELKPRFDIVVDASGNDGGMAIAQAIVLPEGYIVLKTTSHDGVKINTNLLVVNEINLIGSRCGNVRWALNVLASGSINPSGLLDSIYDFDDYEQAFERAKARDSKKVLLNIK